ncbi:BRCT domain-containing protein Rad4 [Schizosaccharomyces cryophilus OY26]|uniref:BRCT domain-containing protein Rad4 n=1 Tax=Schizosaccharomyces cryophilus (strain OY26 / ATCC MYA-4695 / CBS 11777 / NBRC 106824 / NRRL Y48691) TaxID=653667 RepID=S9XAL6_SCHCR|nr:BRCT domain-containing protein Rad4 [Schizosaccharomyces cryophilus OY26]EPY50801.1 BRCT domain-containing protein Rad4 [Schizosaccharomyces cryophilus OY26]
MSSRKPLKGFVICCTNIELNKRTEISTKAIKLGASYKSDLTKDVTHLIAGDFDTPKYKFAAKSRPDMKIVSQEWIPRLYDRWVEGEDLESDLLISKFTLPALFKCRVCLTNIEQPERFQLENTVCENGGTFCPDLTRDVTHLIAGSTAGRKYEYALRWKIRVVCVQWLWESLKRGAVLEPEYFQMDMPPERIGRGAYIKLAPEENKNSQKIYDENLSSDLNHIKNKHISEDTELEPVVMKRGKKRESSILWSELNTKDLENSFTAQNVSLLDEFTPEVFQAPEEKELSTTIEMNTEPRLFDKLHFFLHRFEDDKYNRLKKCLNREGGHASSTLEATTNFVVVPHHLPIEEIPTFPVPTITEWWVERCLFFKKVLPVDEHVLSKPFYRPYFNHEFVGISIHLSGFKGVESSHLKKALVLCGATVDNFLGVQRSVLLINTNEPFSMKTRYKIQHATGWNVRVLGISWLWHIYRTGKFTEDISPWAIDKKENQKLKRFEHLRKVAQSSEKSVLKDDAPFAILPNAQSTPAPNFIFEHYRNSAKQPHRSKTTFNDTDASLKGSPTKKIRSVTEPTTDSNARLNNDLSEDALNKQEQESVSYVDPDAQREKQKIYAQLTSNFNDSFPLINEFSSQDNTSILISKEKRNLRPR